MNSGSKKLYALLITAFGAGYIWVIYQLGFVSHQQEEGFTVCLIKNTTNIPCPSCGSTRSVLSILHFDFPMAFYYNPLGFLIVPAMLILPFWILLDIIFQKESFWKVYQKLEQKIVKPSLAIPLILLVLINWAWNIYKGI
ncbi:DUF2752 domain-containing protein [Echinicola shivajiensis]|uniref:DUF2752 domain-containing protein n=1 Tax=Echinicola shivajiensis TaxID=1035916 RepID=UPI001BFC6E80|nr:DUF2752 domain-containing protein [Echinicola shivajiensis]